MTIFARARGNARGIFSALLLAAAAQGAFAEIVSISRDAPLVAIDLPEGYVLQNADRNGNSYQLQSSILPVSLIVKLYGGDAYGSAREALEDSVARLSAESDLETFKWRRQDVALAQIAFQMGSAHMAGYAASASLPEGGKTVVLIAWSGEEDFSRCANLILSTIDSLCIDYGSYFSPGLVTSYAYPEESEEQGFELSVGGQTIRSSLAANACAAAEYLIEREYEVLALYAGSPVWQDAWRRYYRMIFRDSCERLRRPAFDIYNTLAPECGDETDLAQRLLQWMQESNYEREKNNSDFASLPSMLLGSGSDCDSRSMMLAVLLRAMNMDSCIFVSATFSHAVAGLVSSHPGHGFTAEGKNYLIGETTAKGLTWGKIAGDMDDPGQWLAVTFPY